MSEHSPENGCAGVTNGAPRLVLDTNVVFDWLVFGNPALAPVIAAIGAGEVQWVATEAMRAEMAHVLQRGLPGGRTVDPLSWQTAWARHALLVDPPLAPLNLPRCSDADDQKFIDLAIGMRARWLLTRDRAVLKLARRARAYGVQVLTPERWSLVSPG
ncbi:PIN domain-containing protein [Ideonella sp. BN130291]|uniref:PIN domain-containing protein n=1 Tax=Ideonella sp. BN130291 TaxID=3112940 RepID=UPI002E25E733|nr:PIN domain-containing protein [Ideonella sp. BN130291]